MSLKIITNEMGQQFKMGRKRPIARGPRLSLKNYLTRALATPPAAVDYTKAASAELAQVLMNDQLGCCTASGAFHIDGVLLGNAGSPLTWIDEQIVAFYSATTGYIPGDPSTDQGGNEQDVLNYWQSKGLLANGDHKIKGWLAVNGNDVEECKTAVYLFENLLPTYPHSLSASHISFHVRPISIRVPAVTATDGCLQLCALLRWGHVERCSRFRELLRHRGNPCPSAAHLDHSSSP
jgi:hypothetical protein